MFQYVFILFYFISLSAVAMSLLQKLKLPTLERRNVCYSCNPQKKKNIQQRKEKSVSGALTDMYMPAIEVSLHNITSYQKQRLFSFNCKCLQTLIMWLI